MIQEMYAEIQKQTDKHSVRELCEIYGVSRSGYYKWLKRAGQLNRYEKTHQILDRHVLDIHSHHPMMGYRQIRDKLYLAFGWIVSDPTVWKSMKRLGIHGYTRHRKTPVTGSNLDNAIKLIENALKEARRGVFRVRNCHDFEKCACQTGGGGLRLKNYRLLSRRNVHCREAVAGDFGTRIKAIWSARRQGSL